MWNMPTDLLEGHKQRGATSNPLFSCQPVYSPPRLMTRPWWIRLQLYDGSVVAGSSACLRLCTHDTTDIFRFIQLKAFAITRTRLITIDRSRTPFKSLLLVHQTKLNIDLSPRCVWPVLIKTTFKFSVFPPCFASSNRMQTSQTFPRQGPGTALASGQGTLCKLQEPVHFCTSMLSRGSEKTTAVMQTMMLRRMFQQTGNSIDKHNQYDVISLYTLFNA